MQTSISSLLSLVGGTEEDLDLLKDLGTVDFFPWCCPHSSRHPENFPSKVHPGKGEVLELQIAGISES